MDVVLYLPPQPLCEGEPILLETDFDPELSYRWVGPAGFSSNIHNPLINNSTLLQAGTYSLSVLRDGCASANGLSKRAMNL